MILDWYQGDHMLLSLLGLGLRWLATWARLVNYTSANECKTGLRLRHC